jgi:hypothetical protein
MSVSRHGQPLIICAISRLLPCHRAIGRSATAALTISRAVACSSSAGWWKIRSLAPGITMLRFGIICCANVTSAVLKPWPVAAELLAVGMVLWSMPFAPQPASATRGQGGAGQKSTAQRGEGFHGREAFRGRCGTRGCAATPRGRMTPGWCGSYSPRWRPRASWWLLHAAASHGGPESSTSRVSEPGPPGRSGSVRSLWARTCRLRWLTSQSGPRGWGTSTERGVRR